MFGLLLILIVRYFTNCIMLYRIVANRKAKSYLSVIYQSSRSIGSHEATFYRHGHSVLDRLLQSRADPPVEDPRQPAAASRHRRRGVTHIVQVRSRPAKKKIGRNCKKPPLIDGGGRGSG